MHTVQYMTGHGGEKWSNGSYLLCQAGKPGGYVELEVDDGETGRYTLDIFFTRGPGGGRVEVSLDGRKVGEAFDTFHESIAPSGPVPFGAVDLRAGSHRLRLTAVGKNPKSTGHHMGIDSLKPTPVGG